MFHAGKQLTHIPLSYCMICWDKCVLKSSTITPIQTFKRLSSFFPPVPTDDRHLLVMRDMQRVTSSMLVFQTIVVKDDAKYSVNSANTEHVVLKSSCQDIMCHSTE